MRKGTRRVEEQEGAVSCTEDVGWFGGTSCEGVMICRVSQRAERRLQRPFLVVRPERFERGGKFTRRSDSQASLDGFLLLSILFLFRSSLSLLCFLFNSAIVITAARHQQSHLFSCLLRFASFIFFFSFSSFFISATSSRENSDGEIAMTAQRIDLVGCNRSRVTKCIRE